jgi:sugar phosphate isomerase/epimerase
MPSDVQWILWTGTVGFDTPIPERFRAANAEGFTRVTISPTDVKRVQDAGGNARDIGKLARDHGLELVMDPVVNWHPYSDPGPFKSAKFSLDEMLRMCEETHCSAMTAVGMMDSLIPSTALAEHFADLCDRSASIGVDVHLEFIPMTVIRDLTMAWDIVRGASRSNGGLVFDTWHFFRGNPDFELLRTIPGDRIFAVQIDDADKAVRGGLWEDTLHRKLPGDGQFDLRGAIRALADIGGLNWIGPEVMNPDLAAMPAIDATRLAGSRVRALVDEVQRSIASPAPSD